MESVLELTVQSIEKQAGAALVSPIKVSGSIPTGRDARMLVLASGECFGTIGGGHMEALAQEAAMTVIETHRAQLLEVSLSADDAGDDGLLCGGDATFLIEPVDPRSYPVFKAMDELIKTHHTGVEALRFDQQDVYRLVLSDEGSVVGSLGGGQLELAVRSMFDRVVSNDIHEPVLLDEGSEHIPVYLNALRSCPLLCIFGAGHVGQAVARAAKWAGFRVMVVDDREEFANRKQLPGVDEIVVCDFESAVERVPFDADTYVAIMTRGHVWDRNILEKVLKHTTAYIGMIGSRRKIEKTFAVLKDAGFTDCELARVFAPIGLDIGGETPGEIAIGVVAQMIQVRYQQKNVSVAPSNDQESIPWDVLLSWCQ